MLPDQAPRNGVVSEVNKFLDLAATEEDHGDVGESKHGRALIAGRCHSGSYDASGKGAQLVTIDTEIQ